MLRKSSGEDLTTSGLPNRVARRRTIESSSCTSTAVAILMTSLGCQIFKLSLKRHDTLMKGAIAERATGIHVYKSLAVKGDRKLIQERNRALFYF